MSTSRLRTQALSVLVGTIAIVGAMIFLGSSSDGAKGVSNPVFLPDHFADPAARHFAEAVDAGRIPDALASAKAAPGGVNTAGRDGATGLLMAVERRNKPMVEALLKAGADPNGASDAAPLAMAVTVHDAALVSTLLSAGANPNATMDGNTPLYEAGLVGETEGAGLVLKAGGQVDKPDTVGMTPVLVASTADHWETVAFLLDHGASPWKDADGMTVADLAATSRILPNSDDGRALPQVIGKLKAAGYPWPPPTVKEVRALKEAGRWPPPGKR